MGKEKGFTLIELLAVLLVLAAISLITVPVVINVINESKKQALIASAQGYIKTVEKDITTFLIKEKKIKNGTYKIMEDGNICIGILSRKTCTGKILSVNASGNRPIAGRIQVKDKVIIKSKLVYKDAFIISDNNGELVFADYINEYEIGDEIIFDPGDGVSTNWIVINEDKNTITLLLNEALPDKLYFGPTAIKYINDFTATWNIDPISDYTYVNELGTPINEYQKLEIKNGVTTVTLDNGTKVPCEGVTKARVLTSEELYYIIENYNKNYSYDNLLNYYESNLERLSSFAGVSPTPQSLDNLLSIIGYENNHETLIILLAELVKNGFKLNYSVEIPPYIIKGSGTNSSIYLNKNALAIYINDNNLVSVQSMNGAILIQPVITINKSLIGGVS